MVGVLSGFFLALSHLGCPLYGPRRRLVIALLPLPCRLLRQLPGGDRVG